MTQCSDNLMYDKEFLTIQSHIEQDLLIQHTLDIMCCKKNIIDSILRTFCGEKDNFEVCLDIKKSSIHKHLWCIPRKKPSSTILPHSSYALTEGERQVFVDIIHSLQIPTHYIGQLK